MSRGCLACATLLVVMGAFASGAEASPPDTLGLGSRSTAMGGAVAADVSDFSSVYYNPAGLARDDELQLSVGYLRLHSLLSINDQRSNIEPVGGTTFGVVAGGMLGSVRLAFGLAVHLNDQRLARTRTAALDRPRWELYDTRVHKVYLSPAAGLRILPWLHIGGGVTFQSPAELSLDVQGDLAFANPDQTRFNHRFRGNLESLRYPQAGIQIDPHDHWSIGATYRGSYRIETLTVAQADANIVTRPGSTPLGAIGLGVTSLSLSTFGPRQVVVGAAYHPSRAFRIGADLSWVNWRGHGSLISEEEIRIMLQDSGFLADSGLLGDFPSEIHGREPIPLGLRDRWVPRFGAEGRFFSRDGVHLFARGGYVYERSPFPAQRGESNFVDGDRHSVSGGLGLVLDGLEPTLAGELRVDLHFLWAILPDRLHQKHSLVDPVGDYVAGGHQVGFGMTLEVAFE